MANNAVAGTSKEHVPTWLFTLLQDSFREAHDAMLMGDMLGESGRAIVWTMCEKFHCDKLSVPGQTCRLFERYLANLMRKGVIANNRLGLINHIMNLEPMVVLACCFQMAINSISSTVYVCPKDIRDFLASRGYEHTMAEIMELEKEIFGGIGYPVPLYNSVEMAELLADQLNVHPNALELIGLFVQMAERRRHDIEKEVRWIAAMHSMPYSTPRVRTVHLAAGCVAAAVKATGLQASNNVAVRLARMLRVTGSYLMVLRDIILVWIAPPKLPRLKCLHHPNILRREGFAAKASEPQPSTSRSTLSKA